MVEPMKPHFCPACNGLAQITALCPQCTQLMEDYGRYSAYFMDYSPYREIDDMNMTDGYVDVSTHQCVHLMFCSSCQGQYPMAVSEWTEREAYEHSIP